MNLKNQSTYEDKNTGSKYTLIKESDSKWCLTGIRSDGETVSSPSMKHEVMETFLNRFYDKVI